MGKQEQRENLFSLLRTIFLPDMLSGSIEETQDTTVITAQGLKGSYDETFLHWELVYDNTRGSKTIVINTKKGHKEKTSIFDLDILDSCLSDEMRIEIECYMNEVADYIISKIMDSSTRCRAFKE